MTKIEAFMQTDAYMYAAVGALVAAGVLMLVVNLVKKHTGILTTGVVTEVRGGYKSAHVAVRYELDGEQREGWHTAMQRPDINNMRLGQTVEIRVKNNKPQNVHIRTTRSGYIFGCLLLILGLALGAVLVFLL